MIFCLSTKEMRVGLEDQDLSSDECREHSCLKGLMKIATLCKVHSLDFHGTCDNTVNLLACCFTILLCPVIFDFY